jgi:DNA-binding XRE family transcriptional regulator
MPVYLIRAGEHGPVKIGFSEDVEFRMVKMQADNHERLVLLRIFEGGSLDEASLHVRFADNHLHGEWFSFTAQMLGDVGLQEIIAPLPEPVVYEPEPIRPGMTVVGHRIRELRRQKALTQAVLAAVVGVSRSTLASVETGQDQPGRDLLLRLSAYFGVSVDSLIAECAA